MTTTPAHLSRAAASALLAVVATLGMLLLPGTALAATSYAPAGSPTVSTTSPAPGAPLSVAGDGFATGSTVRVVIFSEPVLLGTAAADAAGEVDVDVTVPASFEPGSDHRVELQGVDSSGEVRVLTQEITLDGGIGDDVLAKTGAFVAPLVLAGIALLAVGGTLVASGRRRARTS